MMIPSHRPQRTRIMTARCARKESRLSKASKRCPICESVNSSKATSCYNCGASLEAVDVEVGQQPSPTNRSMEYDYRYGETDLIEDSLRSRARAYMTGIGLLLLGVLIGASVIVAAPLLQPEPAVPAVINADESPTPRPTVVLATVTQGIPTATATLSPSPSPTITLTPTPEPCIQNVQTGDGMIAIVSRCGHRSLDVIPLVVTLNNLNDENDLRPGQQIIVPYPTPTDDPAAVPEAQSDAQTVSNELASANPSGLSQEQIRQTQEFDPFFRPTPTNPPGVQNYQVQAGDTIVSIVAQFNTEINAIDLLNPQLTFSQCEMGQTFGGPTCSVALREGEIIRVPAPTPTPTLSPTPSGSETPTPTATATFNAPSLISPDPRAYFRRDEVVTLRWTATGALAPGEVYLVEVQSLTQGLLYLAETTDLFLVVPLEWQGPAARQFEYAWSVSIAQQGDPDSARSATAIRAFTWEGRGEE